MSAVNRFSFESEGVEASLPQQSNAVRLVKLPAGSLKNMPGKVGGFQPGRLIINLVGELTNTPGTYVQTFDPPLELKIKYTAADVQFAQNQGKPVRFAFWDGAEWVPFTSQKHGFKLTPNSPASSGGVATVLIRSWGDPPISAGN